MKHTVEEEVTIKLMKEKSLYGKENQAVRDQTKAENPMTARLWEEPSEPGLLGLVWGLVKNVLAGKGVSK